MSAASSKLENYEDITFNSPTSYMDIFRCF